ncbi:MAG: hypothetical protein U0324_44035 [Polyangiales bacterium]
MTGAEEFESWALSQARRFFSQDGRLATRAFFELPTGARAELLLPDTRAAWDVVVAGYRAALAERHGTVPFVVTTEQYAALEAWGEHAALDGGAPRRWRAAILRGDGGGLAAGHWEREGAGT